VARAVDDQLRFRDRLTSFLDFRGRSEIPAEVRGAQAGEAARALAGIPVQAAAPVQLWLAVGRPSSPPASSTRSSPPNVPRTLTYRIAGRLMHGSPAQLAGPDSAAERRRWVIRGVYPARACPGSAPTEAGDCAPGGEGPGDGKQAPETGETMVDKKNAALSGPASGSAEQGPSPRRRRRHRAARSSVTHRNPPGSTQNAWGPISPG